MRQPLTMEPLIAAESAGATRPAMRRLAYMRRSVPRATPGRSAGLRWLVAQLGERRLLTAALAGESWRRLAARSTVAAVDGGRVVRRRAKPRTFRCDAWGRLAKAAARR